MSQIQKPISKEESFKIDKEFILELNKDIYVLKVGKSSNKENIYFCINPKNNNLFIYDGYYSLNDLYELSQNFKFFNTINDLINSLDDMINTKNILIEKDEEDDYIIKLSFLTTSFIGKKEKISLSLILNEIKGEEEKNNLLIKFIELEKKLAQKDEEIKIINDKYNELERKIINLEKYEEKENEHNSSDINFESKIKEMSNKLLQNRKLFIKPNERIKINIENELFKFFKSYLFLKILEKTSRYHLKYFLNKIINIGL